MAARRRLPRVAAIVLSLVALVSLAMSTWAVWASWSDARTHVLAQTGLYELLLALLVAGLALCGIRLAWEEPLEVGSQVERDDRAIRRHGGWLLAAAAAAVGLTVFRSTQDASPGGEPPSFYDLMTWLGTFGTLMVVICGALVAVYAKRREDEARKLDSVRLMRQAWINEVRDLVAACTRRARSLQVLAAESRPDQPNAKKAIAALRRLELHLNPTEPHHAVLVKALQSLLKHSSIDEHLKDSTAPPLGSTEWSQLHDWIIVLAQLVLKIEWVVTSDGRDAVTAKTQTLWAALMDFESRHGGDLSRIANGAWRERKRSGAHLIAPVDAELPMLGSSTAVVDDRQVVEPRRAPS